MLVLGSKTLTIDGVTVFADHADPQPVLVPAGAGGAGASATACRSSR